MVWNSTPEIENLNPLPFVISVFACVVTELLCAAIEGYSGSVSSEETLLSNNAAFLKTEISRTNYPDKFVENSKLQRQLIRVEKELETLRENASARKIHAKRITKYIRLCIYALLVTVFWATVAIRYTPAFLFPIKVINYIPFQRAVPGDVTVAGIIFFFWLGMKGRFI